MSGRLLQAVQGAWDGWHLRGDPPVSALVAGIDRTAEAKVSLLMFDGDGEVVAVAKVPRNERGAAAVRNEHTALSWAWAIEPLRGSVPRPIDLLETDGRPVLIQSAMHGRPMTASYYTPGHTSRTGAVEHDFQVASDWLDVFSSLTRVADASLAEVAQQAVMPLVDRYRHTFGTNSEQEALFAAVLDRAGALGAECVPIAGRHGDFWMGNLLIDDGRLSGVIDWELARRCDGAGPAADIFKLPTSYAMYLDRPWPWAGGRVPGHPGREDTAGRWRRWGSWPNLVGFGHVWFGDGWLARLVEDWVRKRWAALGVSAPVAGTLFPLFIMEQALTLADPASRAGWCSVLRAFAAERDACWVWRAA